MLRRRWTVAIPICAILFLPGCRDVAAEEVEVGYEPATVEEIEGSDLSSVELTEDAARRIGLDTVPTTGRGGRTVVPESAIWVDVNGDEWVYTNPETLVFVRAQVVVKRYDDGLAYLSDGPAPGTEVASVGVAELIGSEFGI
ncbi:MAG: hypothetical protein K0R20_830 [Actinomycetia bacterium]|jgi:hypothetical protein|nr:hypothetical protein [Actinomycetes bacterium]